MAKPQLKWVQLDLGVGFNVDVEVLAHNDATPLELKNLAMFVLLNELRKSSPSLAILGESLVSTSDGKSGIRKYTRTR